MQIAKADGLTVIADASEKDSALVKSLGADIVVPRGAGFAQEVRKHFPAGVDCLADGALLKELAVAAVRDGGSFNSVRGWPGTGERGINFTVTSVRGYDGHWEKLDRLRQLVDDGKIALRVAASYGLEQAADAHRRVEARGTRGRLAIVF